MKRTPLVNAVLAGAYIVALVSVMNLFVDGKVEHTGFTFLIPMTMLSLFVLSAAIMGFLFIYEPLVLYLDGKKKEALNFFLKTVGFFACFAVAMVTLLVFLSNTM